MIEEKAMKKFNFKFFWPIFFLSLGASLLIGARFLFSRPKLVPKLPEANSLKKIKIGPIELWVEIADTLAKRNQGLSDRSSLPEDRGMLFVFEKEAYHSFWMKNTLIPLDFIWINNGEIVEITTNVRPENYQPPETLEPTKEVDMVLELNAGSVKKFNLTLGQEIEF